MYKTGGLEPSTNAAKVLEIDGIKYIVSEKFRTMLRDSFIDWGTFLEIYNNNLDYATMFDQMVKLLNIKENENLREFMIPLVKTIYHLPAQAHIICMLKQFMIYEPMSIAVHGLFTTIKLHYEYIVETFINVRNQYISTHNSTQKLNDLSMLKKYWEDMDLQYSLESSSIILLFLNPPEKLKSKIVFDVIGHSDIISKLKNKVKKFHYLGFCPNVPNIRLNALLEFPVNEFITVIKTLDPDIKFPDYAKLELEVTTELKKMPSFPTIIDDIPRLEPPKELTDNIELAKWYIDAILDLRKNLLKYGTLYEEYYVTQAKIFISITDKIKKEFLM